MSSLGIGQAMPIQRTVAHDDESFQRAEVGDMGGYESGIIV